MTGPSPDKIAAAAAKAQAKAEAAKKAAEEAATAKAKQVAADQAWLDSQDMDPSTKAEAYRQIKAHCPETTEADGKLVLHCPLPRAMYECQSRDPFDCPNGTVDGAAGCKLSDSAASALTNPDKGTKINGQVTSAAEGGSFLSPYVPWGPFKHVDTPKGQKQLNPPALTTGNKSGVTIGTGVDLGQISEDNADAYLARLKKRGVSQPTLDTIKPMIGKQKMAACDALAAAKAKGPVVFPQSDVEAIDADSMSSRAKQIPDAYGHSADAYKAKLKRDIAAATKAGDTAKAASLQEDFDGVPDWSDLSSPEQTVMFDSYYQEGNLNGSAKDFTTAVLGGDEDAEKAALVAKTASRNTAIASRGKVELNYFLGGH